MVFEFLARPISPEVAVTTPLAVLITVPPKPKMKRVGLKPRIVVIPVVVGSAACPELDDGAPCQRLYDFRQRCSASVEAIR